MEKRAPVDCVEAIFKVYGDEDLVSVAAIVHKRYSKYVNCMKQVVQHIVEAYLIHRKLLATLQDGGGGK